MAKEAICALLAILEHFFEVFSPLDLFFASAPFHPAPRPFPAFLHPGCRHFPPLPIPFLHRFQPIPSPARPLKSTSSRPGSHPSRRHPPVLSSSPVFATAPFRCPHRHAKHITPCCHVRHPFLFVPRQPLSAHASSAPCAPGPFLRTRASENHRGE